MVQKKGGRLEPHFMGWASVYDSEVDLEPGLYHGIVDVYEVPLVFTCIHWVLKNISGGSKLETL